MTDGHVPDWVTDFIEEWRQKLMLNEWGISVNLSSAPDGSDEVEACVELFPFVRTAQLTVRSDVAAEPDKKWQHCILHELLHIRLSGITEPLLDDILPELGPAAQRVAERWLRREWEIAIDLLAYIMMPLVDSVSEVKE